MSIEALEARVLRRVLETVGEHRLLPAGAKVMACLSGGKDSWVMLHALRKARQVLPEKFDLVAVHLDQRQPGYDGAPLRAHLESMGVAFEILSEDTYSQVVDRTPVGKRYCSSCSRLRRGILYTAAERLGCTHLALGHHREDTLETFLLNLVFTGKLQAMPARYTTDDGRFEVIRPLITCSENDLAALATELRFPIIPCTLCGSQADSKRDAMGKLLEQLEALNPHVRSSMLGALSNVRPTHLLDSEVREAWDKRPSHLEARSTPRTTLPRFAAMPVACGDELP